MSNKKQSGFKDKISLAYYLRDNYSHVLFQDRKIRALLGQLDDRIDATRRVMVSIGVVKKCANCALNRGGSCCGIGMEIWYDEILLLINLLLGKTLPGQAKDLDSCYFLSEQGCILKARQIICVDYLCKHIYNHIELEKIVHLQKIAGDELTTNFILNEYIKKKIKQLDENCGFKKREL